MIMSTFGLDEPQAAALAVPGNPAKAVGGNALFSKLRHKELPPIAPALDIRVGYTHDMN